MPLPPPVTTAVLPANSVMCTSLSFLDDPDRPIASLAWVISASLKVNPQTFSIPIGSSHGRHIRTFTTDEHVERHACNRLQIECLKQRLRLL